jgi:hypothetical protein
VICDDNQVGTVQLLTKTEPYYRFTFLFVTSNTLSLSANHLLSAQAMYLTFGKDMGGAGITRLEVRELLPTS